MRKIPLLQKYLSDGFALLGFIRSAAQMQHSEKWVACRTGTVFMPGVSYEQRVASQFNLVGHFDLHPEWGRRFMTIRTCEIWWLRPDVSSGRTLVLFRGTSEIPVDTWHCVQTLPGTMLVCSVQRNMTTTMWFPAV